MSVIGRLDEQVESIIISPIGRRRDEAEPLVQKSPVQKSAPEDAKTRAERESSAERAERRRQELPVWLL